MTEADDRRPAHDSDLRRSRAERPPPKKRGRGRGGWGYRRRPPRSGHAESVLAAWTASPDGEDAYRGHLAAQQRSSEGGRARCRRRAMIEESVSDEALSERAIQRRVRGVCRVRTRRISAAEGLLERRSRQRCVAAGEKRDRFKAISKRITELAPGSAKTHRAEQEPWSRSRSRSADGLAAGVQDRRAAR